MRKVRGHAGIVDNIAEFLMYPMNPTVGRK
jgi:hypothetical protein